MIMSLCGLELAIAGQLCFLEEVLVNASTEVCQVGKALHSVSQTLDWQMGGQ